MQCRQEVPADRDAVFDLNRRAFGQEAEAILVDELRDGGFARTSIVAEEAGTIVGHILLSRLTIHSESGPIAALSLAPMAVVPERQRQRIGSMLVEQGLVECRKLGERIVTVLGHPEFYPRFGFSSALAARLSSPYGGGEAWMAIELLPGALADVSGRVEFAPPFARLP
jgi:putative acetyltransferase